MMDEDEKKLIDRIGWKVNKLIDKELAQDGVDRAYLNFVLMVDVMNEHLDIIKQLTIIDDREKGYCAFCRAETEYYDDDERCYLCAKHYRELKEKP